MTTIATISADRAFVSEVRSREISSPTLPPPDLVSPAFEHLLAYGNLLELTDEELARAVKLDPSQIAGLGPQLGYAAAGSRERKRKILETYETDRVRKTVDDEYRKTAERVDPAARNCATPTKRAVREEQIRELERLWYRAGGEQSRFAGRLMHVVERLTEKYEVEQLAAKYAFTGRTPLSVDDALEVKEELETIDKLLKADRRGVEECQIALIDVEELSQFVDPEQMENLNNLQKQVKRWFGTWPNNKEWSGEEGVSTHAQSVSTFSG